MGVTGRDGAARAARAHRPLHLRARYLALVFVGGTVGTACRALLADAIPNAWQVPWATVTVNLVGAFALGLLLQTLLRGGEDQGRRRVLRLLLGTGFLGGFTTYSTLAVDTVTLLTGGGVGLAVLYALGTVVLGAVASVLGILLGRARA